MTAPAKANSFVLRVIMSMTQLFYEACKKVIIEDIIPDLKESDSDLNRTLSISDFDSEVKSETLNTFLLFLQ